VARPATSRDDAHPAPAPAGRLAKPEVLRLLDSDGCVLCRTREQAAAIWARWFVIESHSDPAMLASLLDSGGFCPSHTRRLLSLDSPQLLRMPWQFVLRGALERAERLAAGSGAIPATAPCTLCRTCGDREALASGDLVGSLGLPEVRAALPARGGLCYLHLRALLPRMRAPQVAVAAEAVAARLSQIPPDSEAACLALAGADPDALARAPLLGAHAARLTEAHAARLTEAHAARLAPAEGPSGPSEQDPAGLPPRDRLIADLLAGSCPLCRAAGREETRYLLWLHERWPKRGPASLETHLCPRHLHDMWATGNSAGWLTGTRARSGRQLAAALAAAAADPPAAGNARRPFSRRARPPAAYRIAYEAVRGDSYCRACKVGQAATRRQRDLIRACLHDTRVLEAVGDAHGICLRHAVAVNPAAGARGAAADPAWQPLLLRLVTRLRQAQWELSEDSEKQAWDCRHEPAGSEQTAWRRIPSLLDGAVFLGLAEPEAAV
jgi:hypothetical protein